MKVSRISLCVLLVGAFCTVAWAAGEKKNVVAGLDVEFYAKIQADATWSDSRVTPGNYVKTVDSERSPATSGGSTYLVKNDNDDEFNLTANATRFGFLINGPETDAWNFWGQLEFDLFGSSASSASHLEQDNQENKPHLQTRHAFMVIERPDDQWSILAGQTWDVVGPLNPMTLRYPVLWWAGNYGYRVPQVRFTKDTDITDDTTLKVQVAVTRTIGTGMSAPAYEPGADEGYPTLQGRVALTFPGIGPDPATVGIYGHYGEEEYDYLPAAAGSRKSEHVHTWSGGLDVTLPVREKCTLKGEIHTGANLGRFLGGTGSTVSGTPGATTNVKPIHAAGGWIAAALGPWGNTRYNVGYGLEESDQGDILRATAGSPQKNSVIFGNAIYSFNEHAAMGIEVSWWETEYVHSGYSDGDALVIQTSWIYKTR